MLMKVTFSEDELVGIDRVRGQTPRATWVREIAVASSQAGILSDPAPVADREHYEPGTRAPLEDELARRREAAAGHAPDCKCLNCDAVRRAGE